jgi:hypothetical protein
MKSNQLMLYSEIIAVCSQIHTKHINTPCVQNVEFVNVKPGGTYSDQSALKDQTFDVSSGNLLVFMELSPFPLFTCGVVAFRVFCTRSGLMRTGTMCSCQDGEDSVRKSIVCEGAIRRRQQKGQFGSEMRTNKREKFGRIEYRNSLEGMKLVLDLQGEGGGG